MRFEIASNRVAQRQGGAEHDQDGVKANTYVLRNVAGASTTNPNQIKSDNAGRESRQHVDTPSPAMKGRYAGPELGNKLKRSADSDHVGKEKMHAEGEIAHVIARDVSMENNPIPSGQIAFHNRTTIERHDIHNENQLADDGHHKPKPRGCFQGFIRNGIQL